MSNNSNNSNTIQLLSKLRTVVEDLKLTADEFRDDLNRNYLGERGISSSTVNRWLFGDMPSGSIASEYSIAAQNWLANQTKKTKAKS